MTGKEVNTVLMSAVYECLNIADSQTLHEILSDITTFAHVNRVTIAHDKGGIVVAWLAEGILADRFGRADYWAFGHIEHYIWKLSYSSTPTRCCGYNTESSAQIRNLFFEEINIRSLQQETFMWESAREEQKETQPCPIVPTA